MDCIAANSLKELRMLEEDMMRRQEADMRILERSRQRELAARQGRPEPAPRYELWYLFYLQLR